MTVWSKYLKEEREIYIKYLQIYGALSNLFRQKQGNLIPYLDSKYQETVYSRAFKSKIVDIGNTPHDVLSIFGNDRVGIGIKTWMNTKDSFQKVMQLKRYRDEIDKIIFTGNPEEIALKISELKNDRLRQDHKRLGLDENSNIYHYVTRDNGRMVVQETSYPLIDINRLQNFDISSKSSFSWSDGLKEYRYSYADSQIWQKFSSSSPDTIVVEQIEINIMDDPFKFLLDAYLKLSLNYEKEKPEDEVAYLPMYSFRSKEVEGKSGLNAWNAAPKTKGSDLQRPDREVYIPIPIEFHKQNPYFFSSRNMMEIIEERENIKAHNRGEDAKNRIYPEIRFKILLPDGQIFPGLVTADRMKQFQSGGSLPGKDKRYGQSELGNWILNDVLELDARELVTKEWLNKKGTDSIKLWHKKDDYKNIHIDFAPIGSFEMFMEGKDPSILEDDDVIR